MKNHVRQNHTTLHLKLKTQLIYNCYTTIPWVLQLLCNYYGVLINKLPHQKSISYIIVISELKTGFLYDNLYTLYIHMQSTMFDFFRSNITIACGNYFRTIINVSLKQQLCCNYCTLYIHVIMPCVHISTTHYEIHLQLIFYYDTVRMAASAPLLKYYYSTML